MLHALPGDPTSHTDTNEPHDSGVLTKPLLGSIDDIDDLHVQVVHRPQCEVGKCNAVAGVVLISRSDVHDRC